ncbi:MAG: hypothetical protein SV062_11530 [Thermodesulfobacteriota bacterium]|nr:hypothetical protein [Thermodesulfobacteriota bacterium]
MRFKKLSFVFTLFLTILLFGSLDILFSQISDPSSPHFSHGKGIKKRHAPTSLEDREALRKRIELIKMWKLTEELNLSEEKGAKLFPVINKFEEKRNELKRSRIKLTKDLRKIVKGDKPSKKEIEEIINRLEKNQESLSELRKNSFKEIKNILSTEDQAKYILFLESFAKEMKNIIWHARNKKRQEGARENSR